EEFVPIASRSKTQLLSSAFGFGSRISCRSELNLCRRRAQNINHSRLRRMVRRWIHAPRRGDGPIPRIIVRSKFFMFAPMISSLGLVAKLVVNQGEIIMGR